MNDQLLPCPFCGGEANIIEDRERAFVWCPACHSYGGAHYNDPPGRFDYSAAAIAAWNRRAQLERAKLKPCDIKSLDSIGYSIGNCPNCNCTVNANMAFCMFCGQALYWEDK